LGRPAKYNSDRERRVAQNERRKAERAKHELEFVGIDGEGIGKGRFHRYVLLACGDEYVVNEKGLEFHEIADFLWSNFCRRDPGIVYCGFYLSYDFTQWCKKLPESRAWYLFTDAGIAKRRRAREGNPTPFPVRYEEWEFDLLGMKRFKLRKEGAKSWMYINDVGPFFQTSFLEAINPEKWTVPTVSPEEFKKIEEGKKRRESAILDQEMIDYCLLEVDTLPRVLKPLNEGFVSMGVQLKRNQWFGPGQAAQAWMNTQNIPTVQDQLENPVLIEMQRIARKAYFGGWFEIMAHGIVPGTSYEYDINSAYPYIAAQLPCLMHGTWKHSDNASAFFSGGSHSYALVRASVIGSSNRIGAMLHRLPDGNILRPNATEGWYWWHELEASKKCGLIDEINVQEAWEYTPCDCTPPFAKLVNLYLDRLTVGKNTAQGKSGKLVYNSAYGKLAQSIGSPKYANAIYASLITAGCRTQILNAISSHPMGAAAVLMVATDAVFFRSHHPTLLVSDRIGEWEETKRENLTLFKPGVYWDDKARRAIASGKPAVFKARGVSAKAFSQTIAKIDQAFHWDTSQYPVTRDPQSFREGWFPRVDFNAGFTMLTCKQALARGKWFLAGAVGEATVTQDSWPGIKRLPGEVIDNVFYSRPWPDLGEPSMPYQKNFGIDPEEWLTEDGGGAMLIAEALKG
jgi:DNA polymerase type B, organellar and viral